MTGIAYVDGTITTIADARVALMDRGYLLGDGLFETLRISNGQVFRRGDHAERMQRGLEVLGMDEGLVTSFTQAVDSLLDAGRADIGDDLYMRINITNGVMDSISDGDGVSVTGTCRPFAPYPMKHYADGVSLVVAPQRKDIQDPLSTIKHLSFLPYIAARRHAMSQTAHDAVLLNTEGRVAEATTSNIFAFIDDTLYAPGADEGALPGVTRKVVLELAEDTGLDVQNTLELDALRNADEVFLTNTTGGVVPVTRFDDTVISDGRPGDLTNRLHHAVEDLVRGAE